MAFSYAVDSAKRSEGKSTQVVDTLHIGDTNYTPAGGFDLSTYGQSFTPDDVMHGLVISGGSGVVSVILEGGGKMDLPFDVPVGDTREIFMGFRILTLVEADWTFSGIVFPVW